MKSSYKRGDTHKEGFSDRQKNFFLSLLLLTYTFNFIDRSILSILAEPIKLDLGLSDAQVGLLGGFYFALLYSVLGIPIARLAERKNRVLIISLSLAAWSLFTALSGLASSYFQLALFRFGVGIGEAGCTPASHSLISDYFPAQKRARALSIYSLGIPLGILFGAFAGGFLAQHFSWRVAFAAVGLPGVLLSVLLLKFVKEPRRGCFDLAPIVPPKLSLSRELREICLTLKAITLNPVLFNLLIGLTIGSFVAYGTGVFLAPFIIRSFGLNLSLVGMLIGIISGVGGGIGILLGGFMADRVGKIEAKWYALLPAICLAIAAIVFFAAFQQSEWRWACGLLFGAMIFMYVYLAPTFAVIQNTLGPTQRATGIALVLFVVNLVGLGLGPWILGLLIDSLSAQAFAQMAPPLVSDEHFVQCIEKTANAELHASCVSAIQIGTKKALSLFSALLLWASLHYFIASKNLKNH